jgi:hypothetical protein
MVGCFNQRLFRVARDEITHINAKASLVGIVGLKAVMGMPDLIINQGGKNGY